MDRRLFIMMLREVPRARRGRCSRVNGDATRTRAYALPNFHVDYVRVEPPGVRTAFWRGGRTDSQCFVVESFMDELAHAAKQDPVAYRKGLLGHEQRKAVA
jgi:isoquinoline 1-oxidoreductase beta subunit